MFKKLGAGIKKKQQPNSSQTTDTQSAPSKDPAMSQGVKKVGSFGLSKNTGKNDEELLEGFGTPQRSEQSMRRLAASTDVPDTPQPSSMSGQPFLSLYKIGEVLGSGAFSTVRAGKHIHHPDETYAVKCVNRAKLTEEDAAALLDEVSILKELRHKHIIRLYDFFEDGKTYYLVMEQMNGGELFDRIVAKAYYNEKEARDTCKIVLEAVEYCHANNVAHRDLKPENLLLVHQDKDSEVKIADFGFAKRCTKPQSLTTQCGTPGYVAPEILEGIPYDTKADMWSVGVILYILLGGEFLFVCVVFVLYTATVYLCFFIRKVGTFIWTSLFNGLLSFLFLAGYPPFLESNQKELFRKIKAGEYEFHEEYWGPVSQEAKDLIASLLTVNSQRRLAADIALENPWIQGDSEELAGKDLSKQHKEFIKFNAKRKFRSAIYADMAMHKLSSFMQEINRETAQQTSK
jgi:calcium/calmodulin-dependent protein kinase I